MVRHERRDRIDFEDEGTVRFEIRAEGPWTIEIYPLVYDYLIHRLDAPGHYEGKDDDIIFVIGDVDLLPVTASGDSNFIIQGYGDYGSDLIVNEIAPFEGKFIVPNFGQQPLAWHHTCLGVIVRFVHHHYTHFHISFLVDDPDKTSLSI